ncbi:glycosyltransferase family 2 protein [Vibrio agarivorans]|uniref:Glycosyltransferase family 2 protein n=1 Tax=Vibrio agarivorans TaxID=153622 RepID=A0ABT7XZA1_9VIBR|nr:glycosyltransferase family 2 protein [Vibrio agarivorans]MDN2480874.1 glycosyltransferase family 2 protein [Vibrio agarivorans]
MSKFEWIWLAIFIISSFLIVYHHVGYPWLLKMYLKYRTRKINKGNERRFEFNHSDYFRPSITVIVPAYNEEAWIAQKIRNLAMVDYPRDKLRVEIYCDGCTDNTVDIAQQTIQEATCADTLFIIHDCKQNRGKVAVINEAMNSVDTDLTTFSDVSAITSIDALLIAERHFENPDVGVVNGQYVLYESGSAGEEKYWEYQCDMKFAEAKMATAIGAHGAFYIFRTALFTPLGTSIINDDFIIPMEIVSRGYEAVYDNNVIATEMEPTDLSDDFSRRLRISAGNMQQAMFLGKLFHPRFRRVAFAFFSGKGLRLLTPYLMLAMFISSIMLMDNHLFFGMVLAQSLIYAVGIACWLFPAVTNIKTFQLVHYVLMGHTANLIGGIKYLVNRCRA